MKPNKGFRGACKEESDYLFGNDGGGLILELLVCSGIQEQMV